MKKKSTIMKKKSGTVSNANAINAVVSDIEINNNIILNEKPSLVYFNLFDSETNEEVKIKAKIINDL